MPYTVQGEEVEMGVPERSLQQRMEALQNANEVRVYRANLKRDIKAGRANLVDLLINPPEKLDTAKLSDFLLAVPKMGRVKVDKMLRTCKISPSKTIGGLTERQRDELVHFLTRR